MEISYFASNIEIARSRQSGTTFLSDEPLYRTHDYLGRIVDQCALDAGPKYGMDIRYNFNESEYEAWKLSREPRAYPPHYLRAMELFYRRDTTTQYRTKQQVKRVAGFAFDAALILGVMLIITLIVAPIISSCLLLNDATHR